MNHPTRDQWLAYLYREAGALERIKLAVHLRACPDCKATVEQWRNTGNELNQWRVNLAVNRTATPAPVFRRAVACIVVLTLGICLGRAWAAYDLDRVRAAFEPELRAQLRSELAQM